MTKRAAIYCRISSDPTGRALGVARQRDDCARLVSDRGWQLAGVYVDNDVSAYSGKPRPQYDALLGMIRAEAVDVIVSWHPDRLHRSPIELEQFIPLLEAHSVNVETVQAGQWDLGTPSGRLIARSLGGVARYESEHKSERVRRAMAQNAATGKRHGRVPYGWSHEFDPQTGVRRDVIDPAQADVVQRIAKNIVAGVSLREITASLNHEGIDTPRGGPWHKNMVRALVLRERNVGLRVHRGEVVGDGDWPALMDRGLWEQARAVLSDPARRTSTGTTAVHLLSGIATCGPCGAAMRVGKIGGAHAYRCSVSSCVSRSRDYVDAYVTDAVIGRLAQLDVSVLVDQARRPEVQKAISEAAELRARLDTAADEYADGKIDARQLERISSRLRPRITAAEAVTSTVDRGAVLDGVVGIPVAQVRERWDRLPLGRRRALVDLLLTVRVLPVPKGSPRVFDPSTVELKWKTS